VFTNNNFILFYLGIFDFVFEQIMTSAPLLETIIVIVMLHVPILLVPSHVHAMAVTVEMG
jgi:hypothetical protein